VAFADRLGSFALVGATSARPERSTLQRVSGNPPGMERGLPRRSNVAGFRQLGGAERVPRAGSPSSSPRTRSPLQLPWRCVSGRCHSRTRRAPGFRL